MSQSKCEPKSEVKQSYVHIYRKLQVFNSKMFLLFDFNICVYQSMCLIDSHVFVKGSLTNLGLKRYYLGQP